MIAIFSGETDAIAYSTKIHEYLIANRPGYSATSWGDPEQSADGLLLDRHAGEGQPAAWREGAAGVCVSVGGPLHHRGGRWRPAGPESGPWPEQSRGGEDCGLKKKGAVAHAGCLPPRHAVGGG